MGAQVAGTVRDVRRIGWGLIHETARLQIEFTKLTCLTVPLWICTRALLRLITRENPWTMREGSRAFEPPELLGSV